MVLDCAECSASRKAPCITCVDEWDRPVFERRRQLLQSIDPLQALMLEVERDRARLEALLGTLGASEQLEPGQLACGAHGSLPAGARRIGTCKLCRDKRHQPCPTCRGKGVTSCTACAGKGSRAVACPECAGAGASPDPLADRKRALDVCPWCSGEQLRACLECDDDGHQARDCSDCLGAMRRVCLTCNGTAEAYCGQCFGTGRILEQGRKKARCPTCKGQGVQECQACFGGKADCTTCAEKGHGSFPCESCFGTKKILCAGCALGRGHAWEITGDRLLAADRVEDAFACFEVALRREEARAEAALAALEDEKVRKARKRELERATKGLRRKLQEARRER